MAQLLFFSEKIGAVTLGDSPHGRFPITVSVAETSMCLGSWVDLTNERLLWYTKYIMDGETSVGKQRVQI